jgi:DMSO/TMAO reductase YedYZ molybdopterin-dependent catalytic subunit
VESAGADLVLSNPDLVVRCADPLNYEVRLSRLAHGAVTPNDRFYVRNHFPVPAIDADRWRLRVSGQVTDSLDFSLPELRRMPAQTLTVTLECAGNGRSMFTPPIEGEPWGLGAVSTAEWTGVALSEILDRADLQPSASHLVFRGADGFERGLGLETPVLLAYEMNDLPLAANHGYPLRAIVPGWYAVAGVKSLVEIEITDRPFEGHYQVERYIYDSDTPVTLMRVRSLITEPEEWATVGPGDLTIEGLAWSGSSPVALVEVSVGDGEWLAASLVGRAKRHAWRRWRLVTRIDRRGEIEIRSRATDSSGATQPAQADWNRLGYGNNSIQTVTVRAH